MARKSKWTIEIVYKLTKKYNTLKDFRKEEYPAYHWTKVNLSIEEREKIYINLNRTCLKWDIDNIKDIIKKYKNKSDFRKNESKAYNWILRNISKKGQEDLFLNLEVKEHMNKEKAIKLSKNFQTRNNFFKKSNTAYIYLRKNCSKKELDKIYSHMENPYIITMDELLKVIKLYKTKQNFKNEHRTKYIWMHKNLSKPEIEKMCSHMVPGNRGFQPTKPGALYYLKIIYPNTPTLYKIGITNYTVKRRFGSDMKYITILKEEIFQDGSIATEKEREILRKYKNKKYLGNPILQSGNSELFVCDVLGLDSI